MRFPTRPLTTTLSLLALLIVLAPSVQAKPIPKSATVVFEKTTNYHHIQVYDLKGVRTLSFDGSEESFMKIGEPVNSGFEYIGFFHAPFAINAAVTDVLMVGLGGGSAAKQFQASYPGVNIDIVELDPAVVDVAKAYFEFKPAATTKIYTMDGRQFLKGTKKKYDLILMDAYTSNPYGSFIPFHLATQEFFALAKSRLKPNGMLAYNVIGQLSGWRKNILGSVFKTMETSFPTIYMFPASSSRNVVMVADLGSQTYTRALLMNSARSLVERGRTKLPGYVAMVSKVYDPDSRPAAYQASPVLTDSYAPVDGLLKGD